MSQVHPYDKQMKQQIVEDACHSLRKYDRAHWVAVTKEAFRPLHLVFHWKQHLDAGITMEYTLVYHSEKDLYFWIIEDVLNKELFMKKVQPSDDFIEAVVNGYDKPLTSPSIHHYVEQKLPILSAASLSDIGFGYMPVNELQSMIWEHVAVNIRRFQPGFSSGIRLVEELPVFA
ncbi:hypothetical protein [Halobacillus mangrovi]|uniref:hypothetical protein n=1 Tax=Halobacillus mangrovi TaxID=402384 RepID=UPI003D95F420